MSDEVGENMILLFTYEELLFTKNEHQNEIRHTPKYHPENIERYARGCAGVCLQYVGEGSGHAPCVAPHSAPTPLSHLVLGGAHARCRTEPSLPSHT